jgi:hypothetical protein
MSNIIPLYIQSKDRTDLKDSSTDFNISLRKDLRNIESISISDIVIPDATSLININNNTLKGDIVGVNDSAFTVELVTGDYTAVTLATELQTRLNNNESMVFVGISWTVTYDGTTGYTLVATFSNGEFLPSWGVRFNYTTLIDVLGIGVSTTTAQTFLATTGEPTLTIAEGRVPALNGYLSYNITSEALTGTFNTSYVSSVSKNFLIDDTSNVLGLDTKQTITTGIDYPMDIFENLIHASGRQGEHLSMSNDGTIIAVPSLGVETGTRVFHLVDGEWVQKTGALVLDNAPWTYKGSCALSGDGSTLVVGDELGVWVFIRSGYEWVQQGGKLIPSDKNGSADVGYDISMSDDGNTFAVGGPSDASNIGAAWVFVRTGSTWIQQGPKLTDGTATGALQGSSVTLSGDGDTLAVGGPSDSGDLGAVWIYVRINNVWSQQDSKLTDVTATGALQGGAVSLSSNGDTLAVGGDGDNSNVGAVWVYTRTGATWTQQGVKLVGTGANGSVKQGSSVSLSDDGNTLVIGGPFDDSINDTVGQTGVSWVWTRVGSVWTQFGSKIYGTGSERVASASPLQGSAVAISGDGTTMCMGGFRDANFTGATWVFDLVDDVWAQTGDKLVGTGQLADYKIGSALAMTRDGNTAVVGSNTHDSGRGIAWVLTRSGTTWSVLYTLIPTLQSVSFGTSVAISDDGSVVVVGAPAYGSQIGAAYMYVDGAYITILEGSLAGSGIDNRGTSVAISYDGKTVAVGGPNYDEKTGNFRGAVWVFRGDVGSWTEDQRITPSNDFGGAGKSVALSADGNTLAIGAPTQNAEVGAVLVYTRSEVAWSLEQLITVSDNVGASVIGTAVALSDDGNTLAFGGPDDSANVGATWVWTREGTVWTQESKINATSYTGAPSQGSAVSLSGSGDILVVGGPTDDGARGAVWSYIREDGKWSEQEKLLGTSAGGDWGIGAGVVLDGAGISMIAGGTTYENDTGLLTYYSMPGTFSSVPYTVTIPPKYYTLSELTDVLNELLSVDVDVSFTAVLNGPSMTITANTGASIITTFRISTSTTLNAVEFPGNTYSESVISVTADLSINNNVVKSIVNRPTGNSNLIIDNSSSQIFRQLSSGYSISASDVIDIQLRDERDRIVDLNGQDWIMTAFVTIN